MTTTPISQMSHALTLTTWILHTYYGSCWYNRENDPRGVEEKPSAENSNTMLLAQPRLCCDRISKPWPHHRKKQLSVMWVFSLRRASQRKQQKFAPNELTHYTIISMILDTSNYDMIHKERTSHREMVSKLLLFYHATQQQAKLLLFYHATQQQAKLLLFYHATQQQAKLLLFYHATQKQAKLLLFYHATQKQAKLLLFYHATQQQAILLLFYHATQQQAKSAVLPCHTATS